MPLKFFHISSRDPATMEAELNVFLARHRVVTVERRFVECGAESFWALCVDYLTGEKGAGMNRGLPGRAERKVDYKELLTPEQNGLSERFIRIFKEECAWQHCFDNLTAARATVARYTEHYNTQRTNSALKYNTPRQTYLTLCNPPHQQDA
ncbi:MAG: integrase core domain-containing protein [Verrucomicrobiaceae bacterium]